MLEKLKIDSKLRKELDYKLLTVMIVIVLFGILNIYLATRAEHGVFFTKKQLIWFGISMLVLYIILLWDYTILYGYVEIFYWGSIVLLIITRFAGSVINGARGWIVLGPVSIQPSELAKIAMILMLAKQMQIVDMKINNVKNFFKVAIYAAIPMVLIVIQPDMGMTMVSFFIVLGIFFVAGLDLRVIGSGLLALVLAIALVWNSGIIKSYQKMRLVGFLNPEADELGINLQLTQSMIGIGSGGFLGTGVDLKSNDAGYAAEFVPERQTDFIFSVIGEHWGTIGGIFLLILYAMLIYRIIDTARNAKDIFGSVICIGFASYFIFAILQNIGMTIGIMPITGITLPLVSYGGSSLLTTIMSIALVLNIGMRKKKIQF
ncbi:rod shape-determining protein RodA [Clostridium tarantellae]|uniref:Rod shape-determining protein RodA n=1 Tax=Clostridium tarantellae TaxID=39493 RepID=A0A6I1MQC9_9CLOT|nr:rod shape-determining protein RodA [Clostridium tarantellae]MPQ42489.1 rod shape-determining protein RodA [Clostridium tarantellae]